MKYHPDVDKETWPSGGIMAEDGKSPANCFMLKDGTRAEIEAVLNGLVKSGSEKKQLVFIVCAGHGNLTAAEQLYYSN